MYPRCGSSGSIQNIHQTPSSSNHNSGLIFNNIVCLSKYLIIIMYIN